MEWPPPSTSPSLVVRSPRQTVSLIHNRRPHRNWAPSTRSSALAARDHGPKPSEVYGFVGSITTVVATAVLPRLGLLAVVGLRGPDGGRSGEGERAQAAGCGLWMRDSAFDAGREGKRSL